MTQLANTPERTVPITLVPQHDVLPRRYVLHKHSQLCHNCGRSHHWTQAFASNEMMSRTGAGKLVEHLVPITDFRFNLPIEIRNYTDRPVAACHCCESVDLSHLPDPRNTDEWRRIYKVAPAPEPAAKKRSAITVASAKRPLFSDMLTDLE